EPLGLELRYCCPVDARLAPPVDPGGLCLGDPVKLPFSPQVRLELREHAQHVEKALPGSGAGVDGLLGCLQRRTTGLQSPHDVLQVTDTTGQSVDPGDH